VGYAFAWSFAPLMLVGTLPVAWFFAPFAASLGSPV
jgi:hypothetical protein